MNKCLSCIIVPILLSGILGFLTGHVAMGLGLSHSTAYTWAGFMGFMSGNMVQYLVLLFGFRYKRAARITIRVDK